MNYSYRLKITCILVGANFVNQKLPITRKKSLKLHKNRNLTPTKDGLDIHSVNYSPFFKSILDGMTMVEQINSSRINSETFQV